jgi:Uma2 family endonuclease
MTTATAELEPVAESETFESFTAVAHRLGDIPLERIIWLPRVATVEDCVRYCERHGPAELIDGFLVEKVMGFRESLLASLVIHHLLGHVLPRKLGLVGAPDAIMRVRPGQLRLPDVSFVTWERLLAANVQNKKIAPFGPDLAVEVLSEGNTRAEIDQKRREFFAAGTRLIWVIDPKTRTAEVYDDPARPNQMTLVREAETLNGDPVLPGFSLSLAALFADLEPPAPPQTTS